MAAPQQKSAVANDAIADRAEAREKNEQPLFEERGNGIVEIRRLGEIPELLDDLRRIPRRHEEIGNQSKAPRDVLMKRASRQQIGHHASLRRSHRTMV